MGSASRRERHIPERLAEKLLHIRAELGLSQSEMLRKLGSPEKLQQSSISGYERGVREPPLLIILEYARVANVYVDVLLDDELNLPERLPTRRKSEGIKREKDKATSSKKPLNKPP
jgi:transcriptional regulator with XRE-family HTH domain